MELNRLVPDFELCDINGQPWRLSNYRGRIVIVTFGLQNARTPSGQIA
jgi:peroxiredoxin